MKKLVLMSVFLLLLVGCNNAKKTNSNAKETSTNVQVITGKFIYTKKAAVINGNDFIYGVAPDSMAKVLAQKVKPIKLNEYDMVPVVVKGKLLPNPKKEEWDTIVKITKILFISKSKPDAAIKVNSN